MKKVFVLVIISIILCLLALLIYKWWFELVFHMNIPEWLKYFLVTG